MLRTFSWLLVAALLVPFGAAMGQTVKGIGSINTSQLSGMDLETALMAVQSNRANVLEAQLKDQIGAVQKKNEAIANTNLALSELRELIGKCGADSDANKKLRDVTPAVNSYYDQVGTARSKLNQDLIFSDAIGADGKAFQVTKDTSVGDLYGQITLLKAKIDAMSNSQQMDMLRLQSLSNKRNEAFDIMTNFVKKMQESRSSIVGNMR